MKMLTSFRTPLMFTMYNMYEYHTTQLPNTTNFLKKLKKIIHSLIF